MTRAQFLTMCEALEKIVPEGSGMVTIFAEKDGYRSVYCAGRTLVKEANGKTKLTEETIIQEGTDGD